MKIDWIATIGYSVAAAVMIVLSIATLAKDIVAPGAMIVVASVSTAVALWLFIMLSFRSFSRAARGESDGPTGDEALRAIADLNADGWGTVTFLRFVLWAQTIVVTFVFGAESAEFLAAFSASAISVVLMMRQLKDIGSSQ